MKTTEEKKKKKQCKVFSHTQISHQCPECVVCPQGKLGGCTVISCGVTLNYTTYYLNLRNTGGN